MIQIFIAGRDGRTDQPKVVGRTDGPTEGSTRGPRGPKKLTVSGLGGWGSTLMVSLTVKRPFFDEFPRPFVEISNAHKSFQLSYINVINLRRQF